MNYTVIVAEDEELLLNNLVHKIEKADPDFQVIGTAQTGAAARPELPPPPEAPPPPPREAMPPPPPKRAAWLSCRWRSTAPAR